LEDVLCQKSVAWVLEAGGITLADVDAIAVNGLPNRVLGSISEDADLRVYQEGRTYFVPHHLSHGASTFFLSGFDNARVVVVDGRGERDTATLYEADWENGLRENRRWPVEPGGRSVGGVYDTASRMLGFGPHGQGAVMALAGKESASASHSDCFRGLQKGEFVADPAALQRALEGKRRGREEPVDHSHVEIAKGIQEGLLEVVSTLASWGLNGPLEKGLCLSGGVFLNCPLNTHLTRLLKPTGVFVQPAAHDGGTAIGAALQVAWMMGEPIPKTRQSHATLGPAFTAEVMERALERSGLKYSRNEGRPGELANALKQHQIVCRFEGPMEFGPRALGNRTILANPGKASTKERLNRMKGRASWRPFGGIFRKERVSEYLENSFDSPFMLFTFPVRPEKRMEIPVLVHGDGTTRPQVVQKARDPELWTLLAELEESFGLPGVVNTSFNRAGEPIVCRPEEAIECFVALGADAMQMGPFWVVAPE